jgi:hypothetical protein
MRDLGARLAFIPSISKVAQGWQQVAYQDGLTFHSSSGTLSGALLFVVDLHYMLHGNC